jgi:hypothetical protein
MELEQARRRGGPPHYSHMELEQASVELERPRKGERSQEHGVGCETGVGGGGLVRAAGERSYETG